MPGFSFLESQHGSLGGDTCHRFTRGQAEGDPNSPPIPGASFEKVALTQYAKYQGCCKESRKSATQSFLGYLLASQLL